MIYILFSELILNIDIVKVILIFVLVKMASSSGKMQVNRLSQDELVYECKIRGIGTGTVESMRHNLAMAIRLERSGESVRYPQYPFTENEDLVAVREKLRNLETQLDTFKNSSSSGAFMKYQSKLMHVLGRLDHVTAEESDDKTIRRSELLAKTLQLMGVLDKKAATFEKSKSVTPLQLGLMETHSEDETVDGFAAGLTHNRRSTGVAIETLTTNQSTPIKPILPNKWDCKFSGDKKGLSLSAFLEKVEELRLARNVSKTILLQSGIDLFTGRAYQFYLAYRKEVTNWDEFVALLREEYQSIDYNEKLFEEIRRRTQGPDESIGIYLAIMSGYFKRLTCPISEEVKLKILLRNIAPFYQSQLGLVDVTSLSHLRELCRRLEARKESVEKFTAPARKYSALEPDLAYVSLDEMVGATDTPSTSREVLCYRCNKPGHKAFGCIQGSTRFCYKCKKEGFTVRTCPNCQKQGNQSRHS